MRPVSLLILVVLIWTSPAAGAAVNPPRIVRSVIAGGATGAQGGGIVIRSTLGQPVTSNPQGTMVSLSSGYWTGGTASAIGVPGDLILPSAVALRQNSPNPFHAETSIAFDVPTEDPKVSLSVFDLTGHLVRTLHDGALPAGYHRATWDGRTAGGAQVPAGIYFYVLETSTARVTKKMIRLK